VNHVAVPHINTKTDAWHYSSLWAMKVYLWLNLC